MDDNETNGAEDGKVMNLVRITPKSAPFRRAGIAFITTDAVTLPASDIDDDRARLLVSEPLLSVDVSIDGGETWSRMEARADPEPKAGRRRGR